MLYEEKRKELIETARKMERYGLIRLSGGNVSLRIDDHVLVTPTAMSYDTMLPQDIVVLDLKGQVIDGKRRPTSDLKAILYILNHMDVNAVIHTHQPKALALSLVCDVLPMISTTMLEEVKGQVNVAPFTISSDAGDSLCVILKNHGIMAYGKDLDQALSAALYLEESCETYLLALGTHKPITVLTQEQIEEEAKPRGYYGQP